MKRVQMTLAALLIASPLALSVSAGAAEHQELTFREQVEKSWTEFKDFTVEQKDAAAESGKKLLAAIDRRIEELTADAAEATDDARAAMQDEIDELKKVRIRIADSLEDAGEATASGWEAFKGAVVDAVEEVRDRFDDEDTPKK